MSGRVFLVTGCASGIGRRIADKVVARGDRLIATDVDTAGLEAAADAGGWRARGARVVTLDVRDAAAWERIFSDSGRVDVLINVAGVLRPAWVHESTAEEVDLHFQVNALGPIHGIRAASRHMLAQGGGHVITVASLAALAAIPGLGLYSASKFAARAYSLAADAELRPRGVSLTLVCPDAVETPMLTLQEGRAESTLTFSAPRVLSVDEVADAVLGPALDLRPAELYLPPSRGWLARVADVFPEASRSLLPVMRWVGARRQRRPRSKGAES